MTSTEQRDKLQRQIWQIANEVRGAVDGWDFKQYVLGTLFYRFISENFTSHMEGGDESIHYAKLPDSIITAGIKDDAIRTKGYFIYPSQLFANVVAQANTNQNLNIDLAAIFSAIESSATGYPSEQDIKGLFADFDTTSNRLGSTVAEKNSRLAAVLKGVADLDFGDFEDNHIDLFGDAYEFLISNYAANAGKSGGEFFTPQHVSRLIARLATHGQKRVNKIYDPACGSGSLLLQARKLFDERFVEDGYFGQEINHTTYNLARMNMFLHNINYDKFAIQLGDTLTNPQFDKDKPFDAIVSNPPYSVRWIGMDDPTLINDERFAPAGVLAPKSKADFAFVLHALIQFIDASGLFKKETNNNVLLDAHIEQIVQAFDRKADIDHFAKSVTMETITANDYNLSVSSYVKAEDTREVVDIDKLNAELKTTVARIDQHRKEIDSIVSQIENSRSKNTSNNDILDILLNNIEIEWKPLGEIAEIYSGLSGKSKSDFEDGNALFIPYKNIFENIEVNFNALLPVRISADENQNQVNYGDILFTSSSETANEVGMSSSVTTLSETPIYLNSFSFGVRFKKEFQLIPEFSKFLFRTSHMRSEISKTASGVTRFNISKERFKKILVPIPYPDNLGKSFNIQSDIARILDNFTELSTALSTELVNRKKQYEYYRDLLFSFQKP